jgi:hypothetical protein
MSMPVTVRMCVCMLVLMPMIIFTCMLVPMIVIVPTVIVSFHRPHLT